jgi:hypothetical protein
LLGGSDATRDDMLEMVLRLESELERLGRSLEELSPVELAEIGWRIDAPELVTAALRLDTKLRLAGRSFLETSAAELTRMASVDSDLD